MVRMEGRENEWERGKGKRSEKEKTFTREAACRPKEIIPVIAFPPSPSPPSHPSSSLQNLLLRPVIATLL